MRLYTIYDRVAEEAGPILQCANDGVALRAYRQALQNVAEVDADAYWLFLVGEINTHTMAITVMEPLRIELSIKQLNLLGGDHA